MAAKRKSVNLDEEHHDRARAAVRLVVHSGQPYSLTQFLAEAVEAQLRRISEDYNDGRPIHADSEPLRPGRI